MLEHVGPSLPVEIGFDPNFRPSVRPSLPGRQFPALVDTGAAACCIDSALVAALKLPLVDRQQVAGVHGSGEVDMHLAQVYVPALNFTMYGVFAGVHLTAGGQPHFALIGRTFLRNFTLVYEGRTGAVTLS